MTNCARMSITTRTCHEHSRKHHHPTTWRGRSGTTAGTRQGPAFAGSADALGCRAGRPRTPELDQAIVGLGRERARPALAGAAPALGPHRALQAAGRLRLGLAHALRSRSSAGVDDAVVHG